MEKGQNHGDRTTQERPAGRAGAESFHDGRWVQYCCKSSIASAGTRPDRPTSTSVCWCCGSSYSFYRSFVCCFGAGCENHGLYYIRNVRVKICRRAVRGGKTALKGRLARISRLTRM